MHSGKKVVLLLGLVVLIGVGAALSIWKTKTEEGNSRAAAEMTARHQATVDSLTLLVDSLRHRAQMSSAGVDTMFIYGMMRQIDALRAQVIGAAESVRRTAGLDSISFYVSSLGDSTFYTHYGDYTEPKRWYIAPEWFGMLGLPGIAPLIHHLDSAQGFERSQTMYALLLASQHESVTAIAGRELPIDAANLDTTDGAIVAWKRWAKKWEFVD